MFRNLERDAKLNKALWVDVIIDHLRSRALEARVADTSSGTTDAVIEISVAGRRYAHRVEVKAPVGPATLRTIASRSPARRRVMVITDHLTPAAIQTCRELELACADLDGNMYLHLGATRIEVEGRPRTRSKELAQPAHTSSQLMTRSAAQIVFLLLTDPATVDIPTRDLAHASGTALGSVSAVLRELSTQGYVSTLSNGRRRLHRAAQLFDRWVEAYRLRLHARLDAGYYRTDTPHWWTGAETALRDTDAQWGGETAAWHLDQTLRPARGVVYAAKTPTGLLQTFRMRKADPESANLILRHRFWTMPAWQNSPAVPTPLIYADLAASDDPRLAEAATRLRETDELLRRLS